MKTLVEIDENLTEDEVIIRCRKLDGQILKLQQAISSNASSYDSEIVFYDGNKEFYFDTNLILFFETELNFIYAYTKDKSYKVKYKLYELEEKLPRNFLRISK